jgi:hypothetical protein
MLCALSFRSPPEWTKERLGETDPHSSFAYGMSYLAFTLLWSS